MWQCFTRRVSATVHHRCQSHCASMVSVPLCVTGVSATVRHRCQCHCASPMSVPLCVTGVSATVRHRCQCHCASQVPVPLCVTGVSATVRHRCQCHCASPVSLPLLRHRCQCHWVLDSRGSFDWGVYNLSVSRNSMSLYTSSALQCASHVCIIHGCASVVDLHC